MKILHTIEKAHKMFSTSGSSPLLVTCDDFNDWVCKYDQFPKNLFNELIASNFAGIFGIKTPEAALIKVRSEHISLDEMPNLQLNWFDKLCFGSRYLKNSKEIDRTTLSLFQDLSFQRKLENKNDFLKIALFDIWLANEDRHHNNTNLLLCSTPEKINLFYAIDHVCIFNSGSLQYGLFQLTEEDSILRSELAKVLFGKSRDLNLVVNNIVENFYLCTQECEEKLIEILQLVPESWELNITEISDAIRSQLFSDEWKQECIKTFRTYIQTYIVT